MNRLQKSAQEFNFSLFQEIKKDADSFHVFQRFCIMLLILHGQIDRINKEENCIEEFLRDLNVYEEIIGIVNRVDLCQFELKDLIKLKKKEEENHPLQKFVNNVVSYAKVKCAKKIKKNGIGESQSKASLLSSSTPGIANSAAMNMENLPSGVK